MREYTRRVVLSLILGMFLIAPLASFAANGDSSTPDKGYTINFENVPIQEFLRFVSRIAKVNVIYNEEELNFNVTIVSEEETDLQNVMSALVQVLRINGMTLIEEDQNLLIHKNESIKQIPTVVAGDDPITSDMTSALITKVFRIHKGNPSHIAALITPMLSSVAMVEVSAETRQLIITDVTSSLETIQDLLKSLDAPETPYDVAAYSAEFLSVEELAPIAAKILKPITDNTTLELVMQPDTQTIYIVSTPFLIQRAVNVLKDIDKESLLSARKNLTGDNVLIYQLQYKKHEAVEEGLKRIGKEATSQGFNSPSLLSTIDNAKFVESSNSLMFIGPPADLKVISTLLKGVDIPSGPAAGMDNSSFYFYEPSSMSADRMVHVLTEIRDHLKKTGYTHPSVLASLENAQVIEPIDSILFTGSAATITEVKALISSVEASYQEELKKTGGSKFLIYNIKEAQEEQIRKSLNHLADYLESNKFPNEPLIHAIDSMRWVKSTNSLIFTGQAKALEELADILPTFDVPPSASKSTLHQIPPSTEFVIYSPKHVPSDYLKKAVENTAENLKSADLADPALIRTLDSVRTLPPSDQLIFTGDSQSLKKLATVLGELDQSNVSDSMREGPYFVHLQHASYSRLSNALDNMAEDLPKNDPIRKMIETMHYLPDSNVIVFRGPQDTMKRIQEVIQLTDSEAASKQSGSRVEFVHLENRQASEIVKMLHETANKLKRGGNGSQELVETLEDAQSMNNSNTVIISGTETAITKVKELISNDDQPYKLAPTSEVFVYKIKYLSAEELKTALKGIADHATTSNPSNTTNVLQKTIDTMRVVPNSDAVQFVGPPNVVEKLKTILAVLDTPENATSKVKKHLGANFLVYNVKYMSPTELLMHLKELAKDSPMATQDTDLMKAINSGRFAKESNSLIFTGDKTSLDKINNLLTSLDTSDATKATPWRTAEGYKLYRPQFVPGAQLVQMVKNFEDHLVASGVTNHSLAEVIDHISFIARTNTIIVTGPTKETNEVLGLLKEFDNQETAQGHRDGQISDIETIDDAGFLLYKLQFQNGAGIVDALQLVSTDLANQDNQKKNLPLIEAIKSVQYIGITNTLMATGQPKVLTKLRDLLESIDRPQRQVFIEILVLETTIDKELDFGLRWGSQGAEDSKFAWGTGNFSINDDGDGFGKNFNQITGTRIPTGSDIPPIQGGYFGVIGDVIWSKGKSYGTLASMVNALKTDGDTTIVLSQKIICQDNQNAKIFSGDNVPFTGSLVTTSGLTQTTNANLEYRNIGVTVSITPIIGDSGLITLDIDHEISEEVNQGGDDDSSNVDIKSVNGIRTSRTTMTTRVNMPDKHFLVLSGTMRNQVTRAVSGIPCLGGLPLIGAAFTQTKKQTENRNVIIFVKPNIITSPEVYDQITESQEDLYGSKKQCNVADFHEGLELVRSADDEDYDDE